jgi:serine/threonine protein kinase
MDNHRSIVVLKGENDIFVFFESAATHTSISQAEPMEEIRASILTRDILNGLACLHSNNLAHKFN